jgi:hypothetical protein
MYTYSLYIGLFMALNVGVIIPGDTDGAASLDNVNLKAVFQHPSSNQDLKSLSRCYHDQSVSLFKLATCDSASELDESGSFSYDLVAISEQQKKNIYFRVDCDRFGLVKYTEAIPKSQLPSSSKSMLKAIEAEGPPYHKPEGVSPGSSPTQ